MSDSVTLPPKVALTGPMRRRTRAFISVSDVFSSDSQPGMQACSTVGSLSAAKTLSRPAAIRYSPLISMIYSRLRLPLAGVAVRWRFRQRLAHREIHRREIGDGHQDCQPREPVGQGIPEKCPDHPAATVGRDEAAG